MNKALIININNQDLDEIEEINNLAFSDDIEVLETLNFKIKEINPSFYIKKGKLEEINFKLGEYENIDLVIFNNELNPLQLKNLEQYLKVKVLDRTMLILDIFASKAKTKEAILQVKVATLNYMLPRLMSTSFNYSQQSGGSFKNKGSGEKQINIDKRILKNQINQYEKQLEKLEVTRNESHKKRIKSNIPQVAIVGYTNAGKSTLLNAFINKEKQVLSEDKLFATLDSSTRLIKTNEGDFLLSDTVGFVNHLPTQLVKSFRTTLNEIKDANLILNVCDISSNNINKHIETTMNVLNDLNVNNIPIITVYNKIDKVEYLDYQTTNNKCYISASKNINLDSLIELIKQHIFSKKEVSMFISYDNMKDLNNLLKNGILINKKETEEGIKINIKLSKIDIDKYKKYII